ncbi:SOS response-associated peptidase [Timonella senegalensis]|uniref:SOS response-associated peptidase n=1 Tax=Timonella senegalensis TaxID=1465825 RepID=UPI002FDEF79E
MSPLSLFLTSGQRVWEKRMCGRYASFRQAQDLADAFARSGFIQDVLFADGSDEWRESFNIAPTQDVRIVVERPLTAAARTETFVDASGQVVDLSTINDDPVRQVRLARWGLVPSWAKDPSIGSRMINARSETIAEKPAFKRALASRRCIVPADGYYEWQKGETAKSPKTPFYITPADGSPFAFAGIYEFWKPKDGGDDAQWLVTVSIITTAADRELGEIHDRRPVFLTPEHYDSWLDPEVGAQEALGILGIDVIDTQHVIVSTDVNKVANNSPELIREVS